MLTFQACLKHFALQKLNFQLFANIHNYSIKTLTQSDELYLSKETLEQSLELKYLQFSIAVIRLFTAGLLTQLGR